MDASEINFIPRYKIWLETPDRKGVMGDGKWMLLKAIQRTGSLTAAVQDLGLTYRKTWNNIKKIEQILGFPLLETSRGGSDGGASVLTAKGRQIVEAFDRFHAGFDEQATEAFANFMKDLEATRNSS